MIYLVFAYDQYYPRGGLHDLEGYFATEEEAREAASRIRADNVDIWQFDGQMMKQVSGTPAYD